jgi:hypothetical protein
MEASKHTHDLVGVFYAWPRPHPTINDEEGFV